MKEIYDIIKQINDQKKVAHKEPRSALYSEVMNEVTKLVKEEINTLCKNGKVVFHRTLNEVSFDTK